MVIRIIQNFAKKDCVHYETKNVASCCGHTHKAGVCTINYRGNQGHKTCSTKMKWCDYQSREGKS